MQADFQNSVIATFVYLTWKSYKCKKKKNKKQNIYIYKEKKSLSSTQEICNKVIIKYPTLSQTYQYTTLWNTYARKLVN